MAGTASEVKAAGELAAKASAVEVVIAKGVELLSVPKADEDGNVSRELHDPRAFEDRYLENPRWRQGISTACDLASFVALTNRFKDQHSAIFACKEAEPGSSPQLLAVFNYHEPTAEGGPRFGDHRCVYRFPLSVEWKAWEGACREFMSQQEFSEFLEERIEDVRQPTAEDAGNDVLGVPANPAQLLNLSRGLRVRVESEVRNEVINASGEVNLTFSEKHHTEAGEPIAVPRSFIIGIPVFENGTLWRLPVRLMYRLRSGQVKWKIQIHDAARALDRAFLKACEEAQKGTALPLFQGKPESLQRAHLRPAPSY